MQILDSSFFPLHLKPSSKGCFAVCTTLNARCKFFNKRLFLRGGVLVGERIIAGLEKRKKTFTSSAKLRMSFTNSEEFYN